MVFHACRAFLGDRTSLIHVGCLLRPPNAFVSKSHWSVEKGDARDLGIRLEPLIYEGIDHGSQQGRMDEICLCESKQACVEWA